MVPGVLVGDRYRLVRPIGTGAQGEVYLALDGAAGRLVALKLLRDRPGAEAPSLREEFLALSRITHPAFARAIDYGIDRASGRSYLASEYVDGETLGRGVDGLDEGGILSVTAGLLAALAYLHARGFVHGDLKPGNILLERHAGGALPRILDLGLAALAWRAATPAYRRPETFGAPTPDRAVPADDLFALGVTIHQAVVGRLPFDPADPRSIRAWHARDEALAPASERSGVPEALDAVVRALTAPRTADRPASASEALDRLRRYGGTFPEPSFPPRAQLDFVGRRETLERIRGRMTDAARGEQALRPIAIVGPSGCGKTRILAEIDPIARAGGIRVARLDAGAGLLDQAARALAGSAASTPAVSPDARRARALRAIRDSLGEAPVVFLIDPMPAPPVAADLARLRIPRVLVIVTARSQEELAARIGRDAAGGIDIERLDPLAPDEVEEAARGFFGCDDLPAAWSSAIHRASRGDPRRLGAILRTLARAGAHVDRRGRLEIPLDPGACPDPATPDDDLRLRIDEALAADADALEILAIDPSEPLAPDEILAAVGRPPSIAGIERLGIVRRNREGRIVLRERAATEILAKGEPDRLREQARARARVLLSRGPDAWLAAARALLAADDRIDARSLALRAGRRARLTGLAVEALEAYRLAVALSPLPHDRRTRLARLRLAEIAGLAGRHAEGLGALRPLLRRSPRIPGDVRARALRAAAALERAEGHPDREAAALRRAAAALAGDSSQRAPILAELALAFVHAGRAPEAERALEDALRIEPGEGRWALRNHARVLSTCGTVQVLLGRRAEALLAFSRALEIGRRLEEPALLLGPLNEIGIAHAQAGDTTGAIEVFEEARVCARAVGEIGRELALICNLAIAHYKRRELDEARARYREALDLADSIGEREIFPAIWSGLGAIERLRGDLREAIRCYRRALAGPGRAAFRANATINLGEVFQLLGRYRTSFRLRRAGLAAARRTGDPYLVSLALLGLGTTELIVGSSDAARGRFREALGLVSDHRIAAGATWGLGRAAEIDEDLRTARSHFARAARRSRVAGDPDYLSLGLVGLARTVADPRAARKLLSCADAEAPDAAIDCRIEARIRALALSLESGRDADPNGEGTSVADGLWASIEADAADMPALRREALATRAAWCRRRFDAEGLATLRDAALDTIARERRQLPRDVEEGFRRLGTVRLLDTLADEPSPADPAGTRVSPGETRLLGLAVAGARGLADLVAAAAAHAGAEGAALLWPDHARRSVPIVRVGRRDRLPVLPRLAAIRSAFAGDGWCAAPLNGAPGVLLLLGVERLDASLAPFLDAIALALRLRDGERERAALTEALRKEREEVRRLNERLVAEKGHLETEAIARQAELAQIRRSLEEKEREIEDEFRLTSIVGESAAMRRILATLPEIAAASIPVLITGESGTGKDLIARAIHALSPFRTHPFLSENCASLPESLLEVELFGSVRGAYTDAIVDRPGLFERVAGGTLYLDEVGGIPGAVQARIVRALEEKRVRRIGGEEAVPIAFRLVSSSRRPGARLERDSTFRRDFFYRIRGIEIALPPLRERPEDIPALVAALLDRWVREGRGTKPRVEESALRALMRYEWPGNVRELENEIQRILIFAPERIGEDLLALGGSPGAERVSSGPGRTLRDARDEAERKYLEQILAETKGNVAEASRRCGVSRRYLTMLLSRHSLDPGPFRARK
ncbi:MAG: sigma 54-interacting transcriptional regulator [Planctomycetes bacterium]|nr:sigma 54-interacting transcriptional regulator [Planctomycetota bacterium]